MIAAIWFTLSFLSAIAASVVFGALILADYAETQGEKTPRSYVILAMGKHPIKFKKKVPVGKTVAVVVADVHEATKFADKESAQKAAVAHGMRFFTIKQL